MKRIVALTIVARAWPPWAAGATTTPAPRRQHRPPRQPADQLEGDIQVAAAASLTEAFERARPDVRGRTPGGDGDPRVRTELGPVRRHPRGPAGRRLRVGRRGEHAEAGRRRRGRGERGPGLRQQPTRDRGAGRQPRRGRGPRRLRAATSCSSASAPRTCPAGSSPGPCSTKPGVVPADRHERGRREGAPGQDRGGRPRRRDGVPH